MPITAPSIFIVFIYLLFIYPLLYQVIHCTPCIRRYTPAYRFLWDSDAVAYIRPRKSGSGLLLIL